MKLFYSPGACALGAQIALREAGFNFDLVKVDLRNKTCADPDFYKLNPKGYIPALLTNEGDLLTEGAVILQWIADQKTEKNLLPKFGTMERYRSMEWLNFLASEIHKGFGALFDSTVGSHAEVKESFVKRLSNRLKVLDDHLQTRDYVLGANFSVVDCYLFNMLRWAPYTKFDMSQFHALLKFMEKMSQRPSVRASIEGEGLKG
jgi:glutathione S-transferase